MHVITKNEIKLETSRPDFIYEKRKVTSANDLEFIVCLFNLTLSLRPSKDRFYGQKMFFMLIFSFSAICPEKQFSNMDIQMGLIRSAQFNLILLSDEEKGDFLLEFQG